MKSHVIENILSGIETIFWGDAWAGHIENTKEYGMKPCQNLSGVRIEEVMPTIPNVAKQLAKHLAWEIKTLNCNDGVYKLFIKAIKADNPDFLGMSDSSIIEYSADTEQVRFGECLAYMAMGAGISWFDDHEQFKLSVPYVGNYDLQLWAVENCQECKNATI